MLVRAEHVREISGQSAFRTSLSRAHLNCSDTRCRISAKENLARWLVQRQRGKCLHRVILRHRKVSNLHGSMRYAVREHAVWRTVSTSGTT